MTIRQSRHWNLFSGLVLLGLLYAGSGFFTVAQDEKGVVLRFGAFSRVVDPGLGYRLPWPFEELYRVKVATVYPMSVGYKIQDQLRGIPPQEKEMQWLTGDTNLINIRLDIQYNVSDPVQFLFRTEEPRFLVRRAAEATLTEWVGSRPIDELLTYGKVELARQVREQVQNLLDQYKAGLSILSVNVEALEPPEQVISDFNDVKSAERERERAVIEAEGYRNNLLAETVGQKQKLLNEAEGIHDTRVATALADTERFKSLLAQYRQNPAAVADQLYFETLRKVLPKLQITVFPTKEGKPPQIQIIQQPAK